MCRLAQAEFSADATAAKAARDWIAGVLEEWDLGELAETAALLTSETVTNAVRHTAGEPFVFAAIADGYIEVGVRDRDRSSTPQVTRATDPLATSGRGLAIVDVLADDWSAAYQADGKLIWFRMEAPRWAHASECHCDSDQAPSVELASGRRIVVN